MSLADARVLIVGAGSLGSVYGGYLARSGRSVQLYAREQHAREIQAAGGLHLVGPQIDGKVALSADWRPERIEPAEIVILLCKTPDTEQILTDLSHLEGTASVAVSLQNGIDDRGLLAAWAGDEATIGGVSMVGGTLERPGQARHTLAGPTFLGESPTGISPRVEELGALFSTAGLPMEVTPRIASVEWSKLVHASPSMALTALTRRWFHEVFLAPELAELFLDLILEGVAIAAAEGVAVDDWPSLLPLDTLSKLPRAEALDRITDHGHKLEAQGATEIRISMLQSVERGRRTEVEALHGALVRAAERHGLDAPVTRVCYGMIAGLDRYAT